MKIIFFLLLAGLVLALIEPSLASDKKDKNNKSDRKDQDKEKERKEKEKELKEKEKEIKEKEKEIQEKVKEIQEKEKERKEKIEEKWRDARKEIADYVRDIKNEVKDTISAAVIDKIKAKLDKNDKKKDSSESSDSSKEESSRSDSREDRKRYRNLESAIAKEIESLAKEVKSKIVDRVLKKKEFIKSTVQEKLKLIGQALEKIKSENKDDEEENGDAQEDVADASKEKQVLKEFSDELDAAIENVIFNELNGTAEPTSTANGAVVRLLLHKLLREFQSDIDSVKDSWRGFVGAEQEMKEKAKQLHAKEVVDGKERSTFTFDKLRSFKSSLKDMLEKKRGFVEQKIELKNKVLFTLHNMSLVHKDRPGKVFSYVECLECVLNGTIKLPKVLSDLFEDIKDAVEDLKEGDQVVPDIPTPALESGESTPATFEVTTSEEEESVEESSVLDILNKVKQLESDLGSQISALEQDVKAKVQEQVQKIREVISNLVLEDKSDGSENPSLVYNITTENPFLNDFIETSINSMIAGNVTELSLAGNEGLLDLLVQNLLKEFDSSIQRLRLWKEQYQRMRELLVTIADNLQKAVDEAEDVSNVSFDLTEYKSLLREIHKVKALYLSEKERVKSRVLEALDKMSFAYQNRTGTDLSYSEVLSSLQNSSSDLTPLLDDFYSDLSTVAKADGLKFDAVEPDSPNNLGGEGASSSMVAVVVVGAVVVVLAAFGIGFFAYRRHRHHRLYTKI